jgi:hypothetical protein
MERLDAAPCATTTGTPAPSILDGWFTFMLSLNGRRSGNSTSGLDARLGSTLAAVFLVWLWRTPRGNLVIALCSLAARRNLRQLLDALTSTASTWGAPSCRCAHIDVCTSRWHWHFPTFNVADSCITVRAILLLATSFGHRSGVSRIRSVAAPSLGRLRSWPVFPSRPPLVLRTPSSPRRARTDYGLEMVT